MFNLFVLFNEFDPIKHIFVFLKGPNLPGFGKSYNINHDNC